MISKPGIAACALGFAHHLIDRRDDAGSVAAGVVATQQVAAQRFANKGLGRQENLGLSAPKAVDALFGIANDEHAWRFTAAATARIAGKPGRQRLPLQGAGVLELVDQQMANPRVEALLQPAADLGIGKHGLRCALDIVHVDPAAFPLELGEFVDQQARQPGHALLVQPCGLLKPGRLQALRPVLRDANAGNVGHLFAELARASVLRQQRLERRRRVTQGQGLSQLIPLGSESFCTGAPERDRGRRQLGMVGAAGPQCAVRRVEACELGEHVAEGFDRHRHHTVRIGQGKLDPFGQCRTERTQGLVSTIGDHSGMKIRQRRRFLRQALEKAGPYQRNGLGVVFEQFIDGGQLQRMQQGQRRAAQKRGEPAVEGANLHRALRQQHRVIQIL